MQISEVEFLGVVADLPQDVTQPGDPIVGTSNNTPGSEGVANAIDNQPTKYLNFDKLNTGFTVSPRAGLTIVSGLTLTSANDAPERDPADYVLSGSYDGISFTTISSGTVAAFPSRFFKNTILFNNRIPYLQYRLVFPNVANAGAANSMQISEVELLGVLAPTDVTVPGDPIVPSSNNSPGSEAVANAIDNQPTKYLNFDKVNTGFTVTPGVGDTIVMGLTLTSANDAADRDPSSYVLSGSNDGTSFVPISSGSVPVFPTRFYKNYIFFPDNTKSFKAYRLIFPTTAGDSTCCMQIAEVEFLGVTPGVVNTNPVNNLILRQPVDTPVLLGATATFRVRLSGPWKVQWYRNGIAIPGATSDTYTTAPATAGDDGALFRAVVQGRDGRQISDEVMLSIFTPSANESIGLSWQGSGANGAPTAMLPTDITGFQRQAYWNNLTGGSGTLANPTNSSNQPHPTISVNWTTSGEWGVGTGTSDATERLLNGMVTSFSTTESGAQTVTLSGVPAGSHSLLLYTVQVPQEFFNMDFSVTTHDSGGNDVIQRRYIRPQNSDEYNPSPGFSLVTADSAANRGVGNMMRFDNLQPGSDGMIIVRFFSPGRVDLPGGDPIRGPGLNALQLVLNAPPAVTPPTITHQPVSANAIVGGQVTLLAEATGPNLTYQWLKNGREIDGATSAELTLSGLAAGDAGNYTVVVSNPSGRVQSRVAVVDVLSSAQITSGLTTYFKLDETDPFNTGIANSAPNGLPAQWIGSSFPDIPPGQVDGAIYFGGGDYVYLPNYPKVTKSMTVAGWIVPGSAGTLWGPLVNNWIEGRTTGQSGQFKVEVVPDANNVTTLQAQIEVGPNRALAVAPINDDTFIAHHFAMSANGVNLSIYWDGQLVGTVDYLGAINSTADLPWLTVGANLMINAGDPNPVLGSQGFVGGLDDIAMWNRSLSDIEIQGIYNGGLAGKGVAQVPPVLNLNHSPVAANDTANTTDGVAVTVNVLANDSDPDGDTLSVSSVTTPGHGSAAINPDKTVTYSPTAGYVGPDSFGYRIGDGHGGIASATVAVAVAPRPNTCPTADAKSVSVDEYSSVNFQLTGSDPEGDALTFGIVTAPSHGTVVLQTATGAASYTPNPGYCGADSFTAKVSDGACDSQPATVSVTVNCNRCPTANPQSVSVDEGSSVSFQLAGSDPEGDALQYTIAQAPAHGVVVLQVATGQATYTPNPGYSGPDSFTFKVSDNRCGADSNEATVSVTVRRSNLPPANCVAALATGSCVIRTAGATAPSVVSLDGSQACVVLNGAATDPEGQPLTYTWSENGTTIATGGVATNCFGLGCHHVTLTSTDPLGDSCSTTVDFCVITTGEAVELCATQVDQADLDRKNKRPLIASLKAAVASSDRGSLESAMGQLGAYQNKVHAQIGRSNPAAAQALISLSQQVIDAIVCAADAP